MDMVVVLGKSRKNVQAYILIPPDCQVSLETLITLRSAVGVPTKNKFVFSRLNANTPLSGTVDMREAAQSCHQLQYPERITSRNLRKYIATVSQV